MYRYFFLSTHPGVMAEVFIPPKWQKDNNLAAILKMYPCHNCPKKHFFDYNSILSRKYNIYFMRNMLETLKYFFFKKIKKIKFFENLLGFVPTISV